MNMISARRSARGRNGFAKPAAASVPIGVRTFGNARGNLELANARICETGDGVAQRERRGRRGAERGWISGQILVDAAEYAAAFALPELVAAACGLTPGGQSP